MSDEDILELINDQTTFEKGFRLLMTRYQERLYWHVRRLVIHHEDANDVIQNTFIKVFRGLSGFKGNSKLYTWLYRIATNETMSFLQKSKRHHMQSIAASGVPSRERSRTRAVSDHNPWAVGVELPNVRVPHMAL